jgi:AraC-like DNA-binding protein
MRATEFVESYLDAWNHRDPVAVADHLSTNGIYCDLPENVQHTHDELIVTLRRFFSRYRHRYELVGEILTGEQTIAYQYMMYPLGKASKDETGGTYQGADFITLRGDIAESIVDYCDIADATGQTYLRKYAKSGLSDAQLLEYKQRLDNVMRIERAYLQPGLTLPALARTIDCSVNHLSQVINSGFGMSFFDYVNRFRIEHAKELLSEFNGQGDAVLDVAFKVGFNSNSAFYAAFKKCVGQTPAQFRRSQLAS